MGVRTHDLSKGDVQLTQHLKLSEFRTPGVNTILLDDDIAPTMERVRDGIEKYFGITVSATVVNSGYRNATYDKKVGGSGSGPHTTGKAADFHFRGKDGKAINSIYGLCVAQLLGLKGIERIMDGVSLHVDVNYRSGYWWAWQAKNAAGTYVYYTLSDFFASSWAKAAGVTVPSSVTPAVPPAPKDWVLRLQKTLNAAGANPLLAEDNKPGPKTLAACPTIKLGSKSTAITYVQERVGVPTTGVWDTAMDAAFAAWQTANPQVGKADKVCGPKCWRRLLGLS